MVCRREKRFMIVLEIIFLMYIRVEVKENTEKEREKIDSSLYEIFLSSSFLPIAQASLHHFKALVSSLTLLNFSQLDNFLVLDRLMKLRCYQFWILKKSDIFALWHIFSRFANQTPILQLNVILISIGALDVFISYTCSCFMVRVLAKRDMYEQVTLRRWFESSHSTFIFRSCFE